MLYHKLGEAHWQSKVDKPGVALLADPLDGRHRIDVPLHEMAAKPVADAQRSLEVHAVPDPPGIDRGATKRRDHGGHSEPLGTVLPHGETRPVHRDALTLDQVVVSTLDAELSPSGGLAYGDDRSDVVDQSGEHGIAVSA